MTTVGGGRVVLDDIEKYSDQGLVTRKKLISKELKPNAIDYRVLDHSLITMQRGVYRFRGVPDSWELRARAACIYTGEECAVSHHGAAYLHGLDDFSVPPTLEMLLPAHLRHKPTGVVAHRTLEPFQSLKENGIRRTSLARTVIDLADQLTLDELEKVLNSAWRKRRTLDDGIWIKQLARALHPSRRLVTP